MGREGREKERDRRCMMSFLRRYGEFFRIRDFLDGDGGGEWCVCYVPTYPRTMQFVILEETKREKRNERLKRQKMGNNCCV